MKHIKEVGLALSLCGIPIGTFITPIVGVNLVYPLMGLSAILLFNYKIFLTGTRNIYVLKGNKSMICFLLLMLTYGFASKDPFSNRQFLPMCYAFVICLELFNQDKKTTFNNFIPILFLISSVGCLLALYARTGGSWIITDTTAINDVTHGYNSDEDDSAVFLFGNIGLINLASNLCLESKNKIIRVLRPIFGIIAFILVLTSGKRTVTVLFFLFLLIWVYNKFTWAEIKKKFYIIIPYLFLFIIVIVALGKIDFVQTFFESFQDRFMNGIAIIFGGATNIYEDSASTRLVMRKKFYNIISGEDYGLTNMFFGNGWMTLYMDCPLLQSYLDMGLLGFVLFIYNYIIRIIRNLLRDRRNMPPLYLFGCLVALMPLVSVYHAGTPYASDYLIPISIMILFKNLSKKRIATCGRH